VIQFQTGFADQIRAAIPADNQRPIRVWASDESRFGLHTIRRRRITACGSKPIGVYQHRFENTWVFGAVEPATGASHFMEFPRLDATMVQQFLDDFARTNPEHLHIVLMDNARSHTAKALVLPPNVALVFQPPYSPEVNPCERVWQAIKTAIAWEPFADLDALRQRLVEVFQSYTNAMLHALTRYPYFVAAVTTLSRELSGR
jgi:hypothetical protein